MHAAVTISVNKAHFPVTVLGPGRRIGLWLQGCNIGCKGCLSRDTWAREPGKDMAVDALLAWCEEISGGVLDGVTISGGEPFEQPAALAALLRGLARWRERAGLDFDILCYSGFPLATLRTHRAALLAQLDAVIAEPFVDKLPSQHPWMGSSNQSLTPLSDRGTQRYGTTAPAAAKQMQVLVDGQRVWYVGVPARGDLAKLEALCRARGMDFAQVSWNP